MNATNDEADAARAFVRRYLEEVFSGGNLAAMDDYLRGDEFKGGVAGLVTRWKTAFPDLRIAVGDVIVENGRVVTVETMHGTHEGDYVGALGTVAATGRSVTWTRIAIRFLDEGRFVSGFFEEDEIELLRQLGVVPDTATMPAAGHRPPPQPSSPGLRTPRTEPPDA